MFRPRVPLNNLIRPTLFIRGYKKKKKIYKSYNNNVIYTAQTSDYYTIVYNFVLAKTEK